MRYFRELDISSCPIGDVGLAYLTKAIQGNETLTTLNVSSCDLSLLAGRDLVKATRNSYNILTTLKLCNNFSLLQNNGHCKYEPIKVVQVENVISSKKINIYCSLYNPDQLISDAGSDLAASNYDTVDR